MKTNRIFRHGSATLAFASAALAFSTPAAAAPIITPTLDANTLVNALLGGGGVGIDLSTLTFSFSGHHSGTDMSAGTYMNAAEYGIAPGILISSGAVNRFGTQSSVNVGPAATPAQEALLQPISGIDVHNDVTQLDIFFDMLPGFNSIYFNVVFQSVEFPVYVGSSFVDAFGLYINDVNIAFVDGDPVNIDHPYMGNDVFFGNGVLGSVPAQVGNNAGGARFHTFQSAVRPTGNIARFIIADSGDSSLDSFAFISQLGGSIPPPGDQEPVPVPVPATWGLMGVGFMIVLGTGLRRRRSG